MGDMYRPIYLGMYVGRCQTCCLEKGKSLSIYHCNISVHNWVWVSGVIVTEWDSFGSPFFGSLIT